MVKITARARSLAILAAAAALAASCSGGGSDGTSTGPTNNNPYITISASVASLDITQGATANTTVTVTRYGGFTGDVVVTVEGLPTGVTAGALTIASGSTQGTLALTAAATAAVAPSSLTIRGSGTGITSVTSALALNVKVAASTGAVSVSFSPSTLTITQGTTANLTATITRTGGFTGPVTLSVSGLPTGLTATITPTASANQTVVVTTNSATIAFTATAALPAGPLTGVTVSASGTGVTTTSVTLTGTVVAATTGSGNVTWTFCAAVGIPVFVAVQDGGGAWTKVTPGANNSYAFSITQGKGAIAYEFQTGSTYSLNVFYFTQAEIQTQGTALCANQSATGKTVTGTMLGLSGSDFGAVSLGSATASVNAATGTAFTLNNVPNGNLDLVSTRTTLTISGSSFTSTLANIIIRRNQNFTAGATIPALDHSLTSTEAFAPVMKNLTIANLGSDVALTFLSYITANGSFASLTNDLNISSQATRTFGTVPDAKRVAGDYHYLGVEAANSFTTAPTSLRFSGKVFFASADQTITLGPVPNTPTMTTVSNVAPVRFDAGITVQPEYNKSFLASWQQVGANPRSVQVSATASYVASAPIVHLVIPDLLAAGYTASWGLQPGVLTNWTVSATGWSAPGGILTTPFVEGATYSFGIRLGSVTP